MPCGWPDAVVIALIDLPLPWTAQPALMDFGGDMQPASPGGVHQRFARKGSRWRVTFSALPSLNAACGRQLIASRLKARAAGSTVTAPWPQPAASALGSPTVNGAGQSGRTLICNGFTAGVTIPAGLFFSVSVAGRSYLYQVALATTADGSGNATLTLSPMLRASPAASAALNFAAPVIEGFITDAGETWSISMNTWFDLPAFTIEEVQ